MLPGPGQAQAAVAQLDFEVRQAAVAVEHRAAARAVGTAERRVAWGPVAADHGPAGGGQGRLQIGGQVGDAGVVGRRAGGQGDGCFDRVVDLVDLHHQGHVPVELAVGRHGPGVKGQLLDIKRRQQVDAARCVQVDRAVGAAGGDAGGAVQHQTTTLVGGAHGWGAAIKPTAQGDGLAGGDVGADDQLPVSLQRDLGVDVVAHEAPTQIAASAVAHHLAAAARQQKPLHVDIIDTREADLPGCAHTAIAIAIAIAGAFDHQLGTGLHDQALAAAAITAAAHLDQAAGIEEATGFGAAAAVPGEATHGHPAAGADQQIRIAAAPVDALAEQGAAAVKGLQQTPPRIERAEQLNPAGGVNRHRAALAVDAVAGEPSPQASGGDAATGVD